MNEERILYNLEVFRDLYARAKRGDSSAAVSALQIGAQMQRDCEALRAQAVRQARYKGYSWQTIADQLGMSKQTVWEKYHKRMGID